MARPPRDRSRLRQGYTTGANATAAATAATLALVTGQLPATVTVHLPIGRDAVFHLERCEAEDGWARASTIKDAGDDPDVTHGAEIMATVSWRRGEPGIELRGGLGVGTVTRPGLGLPVGGPAINPVPRRMILEHVAYAAAGALTAARGLLVEIAVPRGEEIAKRTLNGRLGIKGGISILGTKGIVIPWSTAAFRASITQAMDVALAQDCEHLVLNTGGRSERYAMGLYPHLPEVAFVEMGEFLGFSLREAARRPAIHRLTLCGMVGKLAKVAQGAVALHANHSRVDTRFLATLAGASGAGPELVAAIAAANTARHVQELVVASGQPAFFRHLVALAAEHCRAYAKAPYAVEVVLVDFDGPLLAQVELPPYALTAGERLPPPEEEVEDE